MGITSETRFLECDDEYMIRASRLLNVMEIGKKIFTLESLIHEISEIEIDRLLGDKNVKITINEHKNLISHFISPYGEDSLINPCIFKYKEDPLNETPLLE